MKSSHVLVLLFLALSFSFAACLDVNDDDGDKITEAEIKLVDYLEANYPNKWKQYYSTIVYYVPLVEVNDANAVSPVTGKHCIQMNYNMWKQTSYDASWSPSNSDLISTSDSTLSVRYSLLRNYMHGGPEMYPYVDGLADYGGVVGEMKPGETYRIFIAPSLSTGFKDYTRVIDLTLTNVFEGKAWDTEEDAMIETYRENNASLKELELITVPHSYIGEEVYYTNMNGDSYKVESSVKSGNIRYMLHQKGIGDPLTNGDLVQLTYSYGYLQRNHKDTEEVSFVPVKGATIVDYNILIDNTFGRGFDVALSNLRKGTEATIIVPSMLSFGWTGSMITQGLTSENYYVVPPLAPLVFHVSILE